METPLASSIQATAIRRVLVMVSLSYCRIRREGTRIILLNYLFRRASNLCSRERKQSFPRLCKLRHGNAGGIVSHKYPSIEYAYRQQDG
jgi:polysaccharide pyruvyl transferase WcaK-like protein